MYDDYYYTEQAATVAAKEAAARALKAMRGFGKRLLSFSRHRRLHKTVFLSWITRHIIVHLVLRR
jgi:hypothetical protein